jgi:hypothetical protein
MEKCFRSSIFFFVFLLLSLSPQVFAASQGHYVPGGLSLRDNGMPPPGNYTLLVDPYYHAGRYKNTSGDDFKGFSSTGASTMDFTLLDHPIRVSTDGATSVDLKTKIDVTGNQWIQMWSPKEKILNAQYAFAIAPYIGYQRIRIDANANVSGVLHIGNNLSVPVQGQTSKKIIDDKYGIGDLYVRPLWLQWSGPHYDAGINYGCFIPTGFYDHNDLANIGMGFLTNAFQNTTILYPLNNKATALVLNSTYEINTKKYDLAFRPGSDLTFEYGVSQYLSHRLEIGASGYSQMQVSDDGGWVAANKDKHREIHGVGGEISYWIVKGKVCAELRYTYEYGGKATFQGHNGTFNFVYKWGAANEF